MFRRRPKLRDLPRLYAPWAEAAGFANGLSVGAVLGIAVAVILLQVLR